MIISIVNVNDDDGENTVSEDLLKQVTTFENCNSDYVEGWLNSDEMLKKITESTVIEMIEYEVECK